MALIREREAHAGGLLTNQYEEFNSFGRKINMLLLEGEQKASCLVVLISHSFFSALPEIEASAMIAGKERLVVCLKNSSEDTSASFERYLRENGYQVSSLKKADFRNHPERVSREIKERVAVSESKGVLLLDHGGYFSYHLEHYAAELPVLGVVEYALNGEAKYRKSPAADARTGDVGWVSIGQSPLKRFSDYSCGKLIGSLTQQIAQEFKGFGLHLRGISRAGVIGYGRLGSRAAQQMVLAGGHNVRVYDRDPSKMVEAAQLGFNVSARSAAELVSHCNLVIVATDTMPIRPEAYGWIADGTMISTVTSADDSLGLEELIARGFLRPRPGGNYEKVTQYLTGQGCVVNLIYNGEAPNMRTRIGVDDPTIFMASVLHALAGLEVARGKIPDAATMARLETRVMEAYLEAIRETDARAPTPIAPPPRPSFVGRLW